MAKILKIGVLGPEGTFSSVAAEKYASENSLSAGKIFFKTLSDVFTAAEEGKVDEIVVPVENALGGTVSATLDRLSDGDLRIRAEVLVEVRHCLARTRAPAGAKRRVKKIFGHSQAFEQCRNFLKKNFPAAALVSSASNVQALRDLAKSKDLGAAALGPQKQAEKLGLEIIARGVEDSEYNVTRFLAIGKTSALPSGRDKTSVILSPFADRKGRLHEILGAFASRGINLSKIESRPSRNKLGEYVFHVDFEGNEKDEKVKTALHEVSKIAKIKILGSYPRAY